MRWDSEPFISIGLIENSEKVNGRFKGDYEFFINNKKIAAIKSEYFEIQLKDNIFVFNNLIINDFEELEFVPRNYNDSSFVLKGVVVGIGFHWEQEKTNTYKGHLLIKKGKDGLLTIVNKLKLEDYVSVVISSEMSATSHPELLKAHSIISRSWVLAQINAKEGILGKQNKRIEIPTCDCDVVELIKVYESESHEDFDVCADDHCQRYHGINRVVNKSVLDIIGETRGLVLMETESGNICDARFSKVCGGHTESYENIWYDTPISYMQSFPDISPKIKKSLYFPIKTEEDARQFIDSDSKDFFCNVDYDRIGDSIVDFDKNTRNAFRWKIEYLREDLEDIIKQKSGYDIGILKELKVIKRSAGGRIVFLLIRGSKLNLLIGKELEIRRILSKSHLYSSNFYVEYEKERRDIKKIILKGAGWGHGAGLCQYGAATMAYDNYSYEEILYHYFKNSKIYKLYD